MKTTLKDVKKEIVVDFDQVFQGGKRLEYSRDILVGFLDKALDRAVEDALEACRVEKVERASVSNGKLRTTTDRHSTIFNDYSAKLAYNANTTQYDENVKSFLEQK